MTKSFISYSWDSSEHKKWVRDLAIRLRSDGVDVTLDQWHLIPGDQIPEFMEKEVRESDYVLIVCTPRYKNRSDNREGGVGYEGDIMTAEVMNTRNERKFIPILRDKDWESSAPSWLLGKYYVNLSEDPYSEQSYEDLITTLIGTRPQAPPVVKGKVNRFPTDSERNRPGEMEEVEFQDISITGVIVDKVGSPRNDGTPGSALYRVPFQLSRKPPSDWVFYFIHAWDSPSRYTTMHRPGIASVVGDTVILDGTTIDEVQKYHRDTLILACNQANKAYSEDLDRMRKQRERDRKRLDEHRRSVEDKAGQISFDENANFDA